MRRLRADGLRAGSGYRGGHEYSADEEIPFRGGKLFLCNRMSAETPVLYRRDSEGEVLWAVDLDPSMDPDYDHTHVTSFERCRLSESDDVASFHFSADWTFGYEYGYAYFGPDGEFGCFWLSW